MALQVMAYASRPYLQSQSPSTFEIPQAFGGPGGGQCVEQLIGSNTGPPFASFNAFRYPNDFSGRYAGGCVTRRYVAARGTHAELLIFSLHHEPFWCTEACTILPVFR
jgi:hypothetical protein